MIWRAGVERGVLQSWVESLVGLEISAFAGMTCRLGGLVGAGFQPARFGGETLGESGTRLYDDGLSGVVGDGTRLSIKEIATVAPLPRNDNNQGHPERSEGSASAWGGAGMRGRSFASLSMTYRPKMTRRKCRRQLGGTRSSSSADTQKRVPPIGDSVPCVAERSRMPKLRNSVQKCNACQLNPPCFAFLGHGFASRLQRVVSTNRG